jgi:heme A synthase
MPTPDHDLLLFVLVAAALASGLVVALALAAFARRRSWSYFLVTLALAMLLVRSLFGMLTLDGALDATAHHVFEHALDVLAVLLLFGAAYCARTVDEPGGLDE